MANTQQRVSTISANGQSTPALTSVDYQTLTVDVTGTFVATIQVQGSVNGTTWRNVTGNTAVRNVSTGAFLSGGNITAPGAYALDVSPYQYVRFISTAYTSGTATLEYIVLIGGNMAPSDVSGGTGSGAQEVSLANVLSHTQDSMLTYPRGTNYVNTAASALVLTGAGKLAGIWVSAASATPTIKVWDNTSAATTVLLETFTPVAGTFYSFPNARVATGLYITISGTVNCTVFYDPTTT